ncbi:hypothetical protein ACOSQ3_018534 [Xanthoceras sorbifolium]
MASFRRITASLVHTVFLFSAPRHLLRLKLFIAHPTPPFCITSSTRCCHLCLFGFELDVEISVAQKPLCSPPVLHASAANLPIYIRSLTLCSPIKGGLNTLFHGMGTVSNRVHRNTIHGYLKMSSGSDWNWKLSYQCQFGPLYLSSPRNFLIMV